MKKPIEVALLDEADAYLQQAPLKLRQRFAAAFEKIELGFKGDWFEKMAGTDELWEVRVDGPGTTHRLFAFWTAGAQQPRWWSALTALTKKTAKTPTRDIAKAERLRRTYFAISSQ